MLPNYLHHMIPSTTRTCASRNVTNIHVVLVNNNYFMNTLFQSTITEWNKLDLSIRIQLASLYLKADYYYF